VPVRILPHLYLGSSHTSTRELVHEYDISMILRLGWGFVDYLEPHEVVYESYPLQDSALAQIGPKLHEMVDKIHYRIELGENVLVHCYAGVSRSGTVLLAYMIKYHNMSLLQSFEFVYKVWFKTDYLSSLDRLFDLTLASPRH
jgi:hypothetical protein